MRRILLISDDLEALRLYEMMLGDEFVIVPAPIAKIGLKMAREDSPDQIILDLYIQEQMSPLEAVRKLRKSPITKDIPIVVVLDDRDRILVDKDVFPLYPMDDSIMRPVDWDKLKELIREPEEF